MTEDIKLLLHICCGPCSTAAVAAWRADGADVTGTFFNPNIHPFAEHERRREVLERYAGDIGLPLLGEAEYDVRAWLVMVRGEEEKGRRCRLCIRQRLESTARLAAANGFAAFSTTLIISPYQDHDIIREAGDRAAAAAGTRFYYRDLRPSYRESISMSRASGLYRQAYCGCIFSEEEAARERAAGKSRAK
jgi:predicted adenine nucleotide alpha hydrolase (AANH) superfamily ATPase